MLAESKLIGIISAFYWCLL